MDINVETLIAKSKYASQPGLDPIAKTITRECLARSIKVAQALNIHPEVIPDIVVFMHDGIIDDERNNWSAEQFLFWTIQCELLYPSIPEETLIQLYRQIQSVAMKEVVKKFLPRELEEVLHEYFDKNT